MSILSALPNSGSTTAGSERFVNLQYLVCSGPCKSAARGRGRGPDGPHERVIRFDVRELLAARLAEALAGRDAQRRAHIELPHWRRSRLGAGSAQSCSEENRLPGAGRARWRVSHGQVGSPLPEPEFYFAYFCPCVACGAAGERHGTRMGPVRVARLFLYVREKQVEGIFKIECLTQLSVQVVCFVWNLE